MKCLKILTPDLTTATLVSHELEKVENDTDKNCIEYDGKDLTSEMMERPTTFSMKLLLFKKSLK